MIDSPSDTDTAPSAMPLVSILIVTYNQQSWIEEAIDSAVNQDYPNFEVVVTDDASTDATRSIVQAIAEAHPDIVTPVLGEENVGVTRNGNRGLRRCRGKYVAFGAGDDVFRPGKIAKQVAWLEADAGRTLCGHDAGFIDADGESIGRFSTRGRSRLRSGHGATEVIRWGMPCPTTSIMVRHDALPQGGFDERIAMASDWKLLIDCLAAGGEHGIVPGLYSDRRVHSGSLTDLIHKDRRSEQLSFEDSLMILTAIDATYPRYGRAVRNRRSHLYSRHSWYAMRCDELINARYYARRALRESFGLSWHAWLGFTFAYTPQVIRRLLRAGGSHLYRHSRLLRKRLW